MASFLMPGVRWYTLDFGMKVVLPGGLKSGMGRLPLLDPQVSTERKQLKLGATS